MRRYFWSKPLGGYTPADTLLGIALHSITALAEQMCCANAACCSFERAAANVELCCGFTLSKETLRQVAVAAGRRAAAEPHAPLPAPADGKPTCVGVDGTFAPMVTPEEKQLRRDGVLERRRQREQDGAPVARPLPEVRPGHEGGWHEMKLATIYHPDGGPARTIATAGNANDLGERLALLARQIRLCDLPESIALTDAAAWIARQLADRLPQLTAHLLDFYHFAEHVFAAGKAALGEQAGTSWSNGVLHAARQEGPAEVLRRIAELRCELSRNPAACAALDVLVAFVRKHVSMLDYPAALARGWPIGSGPTESACKQLNARLKLRGARWDKDSAEAMMNLVARQAA